MSAVTIQQMANRVAELMQERLRIKGRDLADKLHKSGRKLPRKVFTAAEALEKAASQSQNPKLLLQIDQEAVAKNYDICVKHLTGLNRWDRRKGVLLSLTTSVAFSLLAVLALLIGVLMWRGYL